MSYYRLPWTGVLTRLNRALNPSQVAGGSNFEQGARNGWTFTSQPTGGPSAIEPTTYTRYTAPAAGANAGVDWYGDRNAANPGVTGAWTGLSINAGNSVAISGYFRWGNSSYGTPITPYVRFHDGAGNWVGAAIAFDPVAVTNIWTRIGVIAVAPAGATHVVVNFRATGAYPVDAWFGYTGLLIEVASSIRTWFDGSSTPANPAEAFAWLGAAHNSRSQALVPSGTDTLAPAMDVVSPYTVSRPSRTVAPELMESSAIRSTWFPPGGRVGVLRVGFDTPALAAAGAAFFSTNHTYYLSHAGAPFADLWFAVAEGDLSLTVDEGVDGVVLLVPFKEVTA